MGADGIGMIDPFVKGFDANTQTTACTQTPGNHLIVVPHIEAENVVNWHHWKSPEIVLCISVFQKAVCIHHWHTIGSTSSTF